MAQTKTSAETKSPARRALVVDDSGSIRLVLSRALSELGWDVAIACNGAEALRLLGAGEEPAELIVSDWVMPEMNGMEMVETLRRNPRYAGCKVLMVTSETELPRIQAALGAGVDEYIMKPFDRQILAAKLEMLGLLQTA